MALPPRLQGLIDQLRRLPGVGPKSAQRMAFHLLARDPGGAARLAEALQRALAELGRCEACRNFSEGPLCALCADPRRDGSVLCVVESPADVLAVERSAAYRGHYFVLFGRLSPLDGVGPAELGLAELRARLGGGDIRELILATGATVEGEATAHYVQSMAKPLGLKVSRIAHGVPLGGDLEYVDGGTLGHAFSGRREL